MGEQVFHLVDSEADVLSVLSDFFASSGLEALAFDSPASYLKFLYSDQFTPAIAVIASYNMPGMNGAQLAAEIKEMRPNQKIILTSGFAEVEITAEISRLICSYLHKPFYFSKLATLLGVLCTCDREPGKGNVETFRNVCHLEKNHTCPHYAKVQAAE